MDYNLDIKKEELKEPIKTTNDAILEIVLSYLNIDEELFDIKELTNDQILKTDSLIPEDIIAKGVMQIKNVNMGQTLNDTTLKDAIFTFLLPLSKNNARYQQAMEKAIMNLNRAIFKTAEDTIIFDSISMVDANRLPEAINGMEYELVYLEAHIRCSETLVMANEQYIEIDGALLNGVISIIYGTRKTTDAEVSFSPIQKNTTNGIQISITVNLELRRNDALHKKIYLEADEDKNYRIDLYSAYSKTPKTYKMKIMDFASNAITGDSMKAQIVFMVGDA